MRELTIPAIILASLISVLLVIFFRQGQDNLQLVVTILGFSTATIANLQAVGGVHRSLNSRLSEWKAQVDATIVAAKQASDERVAAAERDKKAH